jgi:hypothetical protein
MASEVFEFETPEIIPIKNRVTISPVDFDPVKFKAEVEKEETAWQDSVRKQRQNIFDEYFTLKKQQGEDVSFINPESNTVQPSQYDPNLKLKNVYSIQRDLDKVQRKAVQEWNRFYINKQRQRFRKLSPEQKRVELSSGGITNENLGLISFLDGFNEGASLGTITNKHPIYGDDHKISFPNFHGYGNLLGSLLSFMTLSRATSAMKIPELISKTKSLQPVLRVLGAPKFYAGKIGRLKFAFDNLVSLAKVGDIKVPAKFLSDQALKYGTLQAAGSLGLTGGLVGMFMEGVRNTARRFKHEDTMKEKEWRRSLPRALSEGFFQKYFVGLINDPKSWPIRFLGDAIYSSSQQLYRIVTGQQEEWNNADFWRSYIEGHLLGEVQGAIFKPNRKQIAAMHANNRMLAYAQDLQKKWGGKVDDYWYDANIIWLSELSSVYDRKRFYTPMERADAVKNYNLQIPNRFKIRRGLENADIYDINPKTLKKITDEIKNKTYNLASKYYGLSPSELKTFRQRAALEDPKTLINTLKEFNKYAPTPRQKEIEPETMQQAMKGIRRMSIDNLMDNVEDYFRTHYNRDVDVLKFFERKGEELDPRKVKTVDKEIDLSARKEEVIEQVMEWLYAKNNVRAVIKTLAGTTITDPENVVADALEQMVKIPAVSYETIEKPINYFWAIARNIAKAQIRSASKELPVKSATEELERLAIKDFETSERAERFANPIYRIYDTYAKKSPTSLKRFTAFYLRTIGNTVDETMTKLANMGIKMKSREAVIKEVQRAREDLEKIILGREAAREVPVKVTFTKTEAKQIKERIAEETRDVNPVTGASARIHKTVANNIKKNGGYLISFDSLYQEVVRRFGEDVAKKVIWKANQIINNEIDNLNAQFGRRDARLFVRNPLENNSTKFVLFQNGLEPDEFRDAAQHLNRVLKQNYDDISEADKRFAVTVSKADGTGDVISDFDNISVTRFNDFKDIYNRTSIFESIKDISRILDPDANIIINRSFFDINNRDTMDAINRLGKLIGLIPKNDSEWTNLINTIRNLDPQRIEQIKTELENIARTIDVFPAGVTQQQISQRDNDRRMFNARSADEQRIAMNTIDVNRKGLMDEIDQKKIQDPIFLDIAKGFNKVRSEASTFKNSISKFITEKFTVLENLEQKGEAEQRAIIALYKLANTVNKSDYDTDDLLRGLFADFNTETLAGGGVNGERAMMAFRRYSHFQREEEFKSIYDVNDETGQIKLKINPRELEKPIKFKPNTEDIQNTLESLKDRPQDVSPEFIREILESSSDPLVLSKILVQDYNIKPQELIEILGRIDQEWYSKLAKWTVAKTGDKNFSYFANMKNNLEEMIRNAIKINVGIIRVDEAGKPVHNLDKIDFDRDGREAVKAFAKEIPDPIRQERILKTIDMYYDLDPERLSYVHHLVLSDNQRKFNNAINDFVRGKAPRGTKVADPYMDALLTKRKMPTLRSLVEAGYRIEEDYMNVLQSTMRYAFMKRSNEVIADQWKESYLRGFSQALEASAEKKNPEILIEWFRENSGYFYLPAKSEIAQLNNRVEEIDTRLNVIDNKADPLFIELQREKADIQERLRMMNLLRDTFSKSKIKDDIVGAVLGTEDFIPANFNSFITDRGSKGLEGIFSGVKTKIDDLRSANISNYDGLYFNRVLWKGMRNLVFRNDGLPKDFKYSFQNTLRNFYDKTNRFLKIIRFYKPTIIMMNDLVQAGMANPKFMRYLPWAFRTYRNPNAKDAKGDLSTDSQFFQDMERMNLFNKSVSFEPLLSESARTIGNIIGHPGIFGKISQDLGFEKNAFRKVGVGIKDLWRAQQQVTWDIDGIIRLATARAMYDKFSKVYDPERAKFMAAEWANMFLVKYSRIPSSTRRVLNRLGFVLTYRTQTLRMYKEMMRMAANSVKRRLGIPVETPMFKVSDDVKKQAWFEAQPLIRSLIMKSAVKTLLFTLLGFGYNSPWDAITGYRAKRKKGEGVLDSTMEFLSLGTPLFDIEKHITRISRAPMVFLKYNMAAFPGLLYSLARNENIITGEKMVTADWSKKPRKATGQLGMQMLTTYFPWAGEISNYTAKDIGIIEGLINFFGLGYYYNYKKPRTLLEDFREAMDKSKDIQEQKRALKQFNYELRRAYQVLFDKEFKTLADRMEEANETLGAQRLQ